MLRQSAMAPVTSMLDETNMGNSLSKVTKILSWIILAINVLILFNGKTAPGWINESVMRYFYATSLICMLIAIVYHTGSHLFNNPRFESIKKYVGPLILYGYIAFALFILIPIGGHVGNQLHGP
jgi:hypothetical protein